MKMMRFIASLFTVMLAERHEMRYHALTILSLLRERQEESTRMLLVTIADGLLHMSMERLALSSPV